MIDKIGEGCQSLKAFFDNPTSTLMEKSRKRMKECVGGIYQSIEVLHSASKLLGFTVSDMISIAQLRSGNFKKDLSLIDIKKTIDEIMKIQRDQFEMKKIKSNVDFIDFWPEFNY
tara:strand:- start:3308 stop:3652 length:345 start_codon:yes stop_codon:yes gene_type:complete